MTITEIVLEPSEFKSIVESLNRFYVEINRNISNVQFLSPEQKILKDKGGKAKELADGLEKLSSEVASYVIRRVESNQ